MQNTVIEFQSLLGFVRIKPFDDYKTFMEEIGKKLQRDSGSYDPGAIKSYRPLSSLFFCDVQRQPKSMVDLF